MNYSSVHTGLQPLFRVRRAARAVWLLLAVGLVAGCGSLPRQPVPVERMEVAQVSGMPGVRAVGLQHSPAFQEDLLVSVEGETEDVYCPLPDGTRGYCVLALSGGGSFGAFGAGLLNGWTETGARPNFKLVTGVSTGALTAPFAFLGPDYDDELKAVYTTIETKDILSFRGIFGILGSESFADTSPLAGLIARFVTEDFLDAIAAAHAAGRRLYIGTTNMDSQQFIVWNMGAIAQRGTPAIPLFRDVLLASSSIPTAFPPVMIEVEADGRRYDEMHADGGTIAQVFFFGNVVDFHAVRQTMAARGSPVRSSGARIYVIRNALVGAEPKQVERSLPDITGRAVSTMIKSMGLSDLNRIYGKANARGIDFNYVDIPADFVWQGEEEFDSAEMNRLFALGYAIGKNGGGWRKTPYGYNPDDWPDRQLLAE